MGLALTHMLTWGVLCVGSTYLSAIVCHVCANNTESCRTCRSNCIYSYATNSGNVRTEQRNTQRSIYYPEHELCYRDASPSYLNSSHGCDVGEIRMGKSNKAAWISLRLTINVTSTHQGFVFVFVFCVGPAVTHRRYWSLLGLFY
jgi:hypothetical protein